MTIERNTQRSFVIGVGMTRFEKPGSRDWDYPDMAREAMQAALSDAGIPYESVEQAFASYVAGDSTSGQRAVYELGMTGIPVVNVNNNCASGSSALYLARQTVKGGLADCALAVGFEKMERGSLGLKYADRASPVEKHFASMAEACGWADEPPTPQLFANQAREHMELYGSEPDHYAWIAWKNHKHSVNNPYAQFQTEYSLDEIKQSRLISSPLTKLQCSPTSDGAGAVLVASEAFVARHGLWDRAVEMIGQAMATDLPGAFDDRRSPRQILGFEMVQKAADIALREAGLGIDAVDVIELHDCFSSNELLTYEALGLAPIGQGHKLVDEQATTYGGKVVVNPSGGLISKGHPIGATGLAQCAELTWQLRGTAGQRQVTDARVGLQQNHGLGSAVVVSVYQAPDPSS